MFKYKKITLVGSISEIVIDLKKSIINQYIVYTLSGIALTFKHIILITFVFFILKIN